jgi:hypothetical protein
MAYNNYFPMNYQQYYPQQMQGIQNMPQQNQPQQTNGIIWVQGEAGAKSYLVAPNSTVTLWDTESEVIYVKSADASGMPSMKVLDYKIRGASEPQNIPMQNGFATKDDLDALRADFNALKAQIEEGVAK